MGTLPRDIHCLPRCRSDRRGECPVWVRGRCGLSLAASSRGGFSRAAFSRAANGPHLEDVVIGPTFGESVVAPQVVLALDAYGARLGGDLEALPCGIPGAGGKE
eukprot:scaffold30625_cov112-Isochrysis_galbana.AAC.1